MSRRRLLAVALALLGLGPASGAAAARPPVLIDEPGTWTLARLGYGPIVLRENEQTARTVASVGYRLPAGAAQGASRWYVLRLHYVVALRREAASGEFNVAVATDGRYCASTIFTVLRRNGRLESISDDLGMIGGHVRTASTSLVREIRFANFLVYAGVRPGPNVMRFELTSNAVPMVRYVRILPDTALELTRLGPPVIRVELRAPSQPLRVGEAARVGFVVRHLNGQPVTSATVSLRAGAEPTRSRTLAWASGGPLQGSFRLTPTREGRVRLEVDAVAALTGARATRVVTVLPPRPTGPDWWIWPVLAGAVIAGTIGAWRAVRRRTQQP